MNNFYRATSCKVRLLIALSRQCSKRLYTTQESLSTHSIHLPSFCNFFYRKACVLCADQLFDQPHKNCSRHKHFFSSQCMPNIIWRLGLRPDPREEFKWPGRSGSKGRKGKEGGKERGKGGEKWKEYKGRRAAHLEKSSKVGAYGTGYWLVGVHFSNHGSDLSFHWIAATSKSMKTHRIFSRGAQIRGSGDESSQRSPGYSPAKPP